MKKLKIVSKKDWIILRLLVVALNNKLHNEPDVVKTLNYMSKKYSLDAVDDFADQMRAERGVTHEQ